MKDGTYQLWRSDTIKTTGGSWPTAMLDPNSYVGVWTDKDGNKHLDYAVHCNNLLDAVMCASDRGQIAIWDIEAGKEVLV